MMRTAIAIPALPIMREATSTVEVVEMSLQTFNVFTIRIWYMASGGKLQTESKFYKKISSLVTMVTSRW